MQEIYDITTPPCPLLVKDNGRYWCQLVRTADESFPEENTELRKALGIGEGCYLPTNIDRQNIINPIFRTMRKAKND